MFLANHAQSEHPQKAFFCNNFPFECDSGMFVSLEQLDVHCRKFHPEKKEAEKKFRCKFCYYQSPSEYIVYLHEAQKHAAQKEKAQKNKKQPAQFRSDATDCPDCDEMFATPLLLQKHQSLFHFEKTKCQHCW